MEFLLLGVDIGSRHHADEKHGDENDVDFLDAFITLLSDIKILGLCYNS